jgi:hypothetical protein
MRVTSNAVLRFVWVGCIALILSTPVVGQRIWRVNYLGGPGVDFLDVPPAVAAASPNDVIWVYLDARSPVAHYYTAPTIDKPIAITGFSTFGTPGTSYPSGASLMGQIVITGIPAGGRVVLSDMSLHPVPPPVNQPPLPHGVVARDCAGDIVMDDLYYTSQGFANATFTFDRCANVILRGCQINLGGAPIQLTDSSLLLSSTWVTWVAPWLPGGQPSINYTQTREALRLRNSNATLIASRVDGVREFRLNPPSNWWEKPGAIIESGTLTIGPASLIRGGLFDTGFVDPWGQPIWDFTNGYELLSPQAQVFCDRLGQYSLHPYIPLRSPPAQPTTLHATYHGWIVANEQYQVWTAGPPNGFAILAAGSAAIAPLPLPVGTLAIDPSFLVVLGAAPLDSRGIATWTLHCPVYVPVSYLFAFQAGVLSPAGDIALTTASPFTVGWEHGRIP